MRKLVLCLFAIMCAANAFGEPMPEKKVPDPLKPWIDWVLHGEEEKDCPAAYNSTSKQICSWPSVLKLEFNSDNAVFEQKWEVFAENMWLKLPGNSKFWPSKVRVDEQEWLVGKKDGHPAIYIEEPGVYSVKGIFYFDRRPEWIQIPERSGLVELKVSGKKIDFPRLDPGGRLWLKHDMALPGDAQREDRHETVVHRLIKDTIPMQIVTHLDLSVSGRHRKINIGSIGVKEFIPFKIDSRLPVKIEENGTLLIQAKPGKWRVRIYLRHKGRADTLSQTMTGSFKTQREIWSFEPHNHLRIVDIKGPAQIDPEQTAMPGEWRSFPAYLVNSDTDMKFIEKKRGDPRPAPDKLDFQRILWLDFDGKGFSVKDSISGSMNTGWRLAINPPIDPGRVILNGKEQFITKLDDSGKAGIEMRYGSVNLTAESRIESSGVIPVAGWDRDFHSAKGELNLPPGWSLFDASGIDNIKKTWLKSWSLLDLFLVLIISLAVARLISIKWGVTALIVLVLIQHEPGAPLWVFLNILAAAALLKVVPKGKIYSLIHNYRLISILTLIIISLPFMVNQIKHGIYPQLEYGWRAMERVSRQHYQPQLQKDGAVLQGKPSFAVKKKLARPLIKKSELEENIKGKALSSSYYSDSLQRQKKVVGVNGFDSNARVQTGAGMPTWRWNSIKFSWSGPVKEDETMKFVFISPGVNMVLGFLRVILLGLLIAGICGVKFSRSEGFDFKSIKPGGLTAVLLLCFSLFLSHPVNADTLTSFPPDKLLNELKLRLTEREKPECAPACAVNPRIKIVIDNKKLSMAMEVHSLYENIAVPLPGKSKHWLPSIVSVNGESVSSLYRDPKTGHFWIRLPKGIHRIELKGNLPLRNSVELPFLLKPNHVEITARGWNIDGLHTNGIVNKQLKFTREESEKKEQEVFETGLLPQFVEITRIFHLGLAWQIETVVERKTPTGAAVVLQVPLLEGESVTSDITVKNGKVMINLGPEQTRTGWVSSLEKQEILKLKALDTLDFSEVWKLNIGTMWHSDIKGIPAIHHQNRAGRWFPEFRPWPGEKIEIDISRPKGVEGQTHTIERSVLDISPGKRITNADLSLNIRSSRGSRHTITLPPGSKLQKLLINDKSQPFNQTGEQVTLPIVPGAQTIKLSWRTSMDIGFNFKTPAVDLSLESVDSYISIKMPQNRWILFCTGPYVGPAVLFWSSLFVLILLSFGLGKLKITPLKGYHWFLLGLGLIQASILTLLPVAAWLIALGLRKNKTGNLSNAAFNSVQIILPALTILAVVVLFYGIQNGLLGYPDMQIAGNGSYNHHLKWYQDITENTLPQPVVFSLPMTLYRVLILAWALWIAFALIKWLRWGWECYSTNGLWRKVKLKKFRKTKKRTSEEENAEVIKE